jgi:FkbM family methyltransferase
VSNLYDTALAHYQEANWEQAALGMQAVLRAEPGQTAAHYYLGLALVELGRADEGIENYRELLVRLPACLEGWINLGDLYGKAGKPEQAIAAWQQALALDEESLLVLNNLALTCQAEGLLNQAARYFRQAVALAPGRHDLWFALGNLLLGQARFSQAETAFNQALRVNPGDAQTFNNLAVTLGKLKREADAIAAFRAALACDPHLADGLNNLALALHAIDQRDEAIELLRRCTASHPGYALGWANLGMVLQGMGQLTEAVQVIDRALALTPNQSGWLWNQSLAYLTMGDFARGWQHFEARHAPDKADPLATPPDLPYPMWRGESLAGKRILLVKEQGFGDQIQCLRYAAQLAEMGAAVGAWVHPAVAAVAGSVPGVVAVTTDVPSAHYDYWAFMMSLPVHFKAGFDTLPGPVPYMQADAAKLGTSAARIDAFAQGRLRVALNWAGNPSHPNDRHRSVPLATLAPWFALPGIAWISLQKDRGPEADRWVEQGVLLPMGDAIQDFSDTAALIAVVDLVITVDSAVAHLAGAQGARTWLLLPDNADYRWMLQRTDTPWYPTVQLWRQPQLGAWAPVILRMCMELAREGAEQLGSQSAPQPSAGGLLALSGAQQLVRGRHGWFVFNQHDQYVGQALARYGEYAEYEVQVFARIMAGHGDADIIEVGSNIGSQSVPLARMARQFFAFEPQPVVFQTLCANLAVNGLVNARAFPFGVGETQSMMKVPPVHYDQGGNFGGVSLLPDGEGTPVRIVALDEFLPEWVPNLRVRLIKADVEGMEHAVLLGAKALIATHRPFLYVENDRVESSGALIRLMRDMGYRLYWHCPLLYNAGNFFANTDNCYEGIAAFNMLGVPQECTFDTSGMTAVGADDEHILRPRASS